MAAKKRRLTFIECNNDINCMIDLAKVVDLVLLLVDASFGFEMETFEFLNICQVRCLILNPYLTYAGHWEHEGIHSVIVFECDVRR